MHFLLNILFCCLDEDDISGGEADDNVGVAEIPEDTGGNRFLFHGDSIDVIFILLSDDFISCFKDMVETSVELFPRPEDILEEVAGVIHYFQNTIGKFYWTKLQTSVLVKSQINLA